MSQRVLAFVGARGGSKGLPGKNIKTLSGKPLITWTVEAALECSFINEVLISTDSSDILNTVKNSCRYEKNYLRPDFLAEDNSNVVDAVNHGLEWYAAQGMKFDSVILLQPTSPLRTSKHIALAYEHYLKNEAKLKSLVSVTPVSAKYNWIMSGDGSFIKFVQSDKIGQRQSLGDLYLPNGAIYISQVSDENKIKTFFDQNIIPFVMSEEESVDIDTAKDFVKAEVLMAQVKNKEGSL